MAEDSVQKAGSVKITELNLISSKNIVFDLRDFLVELNIYEDMFSNTLTGNMVLSDSLNLIEKVPIIGDEQLVLDIETPSSGQKISKTFRAYKVTDRKVVRDNNTQIFVLHFASIELFKDILSPIFQPFEGTVGGIATSIYNSYISVGRPLIDNGATANQIKFICPGWSPFYCINWLASKGIPLFGSAKNIIFYESNKAFYFTSVEELFTKKLSIGTYSISASNIRDGASSPDINREYFIAKDVEMIETADFIKHNTSGYLANQLITLDIFNKKYSVTSYDHPSAYKRQHHTSGPGATAIPPFGNNPSRSSASNISFYSVNPKLYNDFPDNISEKMSSIHGNRKSSMLELTNIKMHITVPGRTDVEVGNMLYFSYPELGPKDASSDPQSQDTSFSGFYLITAIHHKINKIDHSMRMEIIKDSLTM